MSRNREFGADTVPALLTTSHHPVVVADVDRQADPAVISAELQRRHLPPIGPGNGLLYYLSSQRPTALRDVIQGNNHYLPSVPGFAAKRGYDLASGVGVLQFAATARDLPAPATRRTSGLG